MKKSAIIFITFLFQFSARAQDSSFTISGQLNKVKSGIIFLNIYEGTKSVKDSAAITQGAFTFKGFVSAPYFATLTLPAKQDDYFTFYVEPASMSISGDGDSLRLLAVQGSAINNDDRLLNERMKNITQWEDANSKIYDRAHEAKNVALMDSLDAVDDSVLLAKRKVVAGFVKDYSNSTRAAMAILENYSYYAEASDVEPLYNELSPAIQLSPKGMEIKKLIAAYSNVAIGKRAPEISQPSPEGKTITLSSLQGNYVLVDFWASWCGPCRRENPKVVAAYNEFKNKNFTIYAVSYDTKKDKWEKAIKDDGLTWNQVSELTGWMNSTSERYGIKAIPSNVLLDKDGIIIAKNLFGKQLVNKLHELTGK